jgi:hypothetical protein
MLPAAASNMDGFLWRGSCFSSTQLNRFSSSQQNLSPPFFLILLFICAYKAWVISISTLKHLRCKRYYFHNLNGFSQGNYLLDATAPNIDGLFEEIHVFLQLT